MRAVLFSTFLLLGLLACNRSPKPVCYVLDSGFTGWVKIVYNRPGAPPLPLQGGYRLVRVGRDHRIDTSSRINPSWDKSEFFYQSAAGELTRLSSKDGVKRLLWGMEKRLAADGDQDIFFVGPERQFTRGKVGNEIESNMTSLPTPPSSPDPVADSLTPRDHMNVETELPK